MKRWTLLVLLLLTSLAHGQSSATSPGGGVMIMTAPIGATPRAGTVAVVTNGASNSDCTTGGGSNFVFCVYTGSAWTSVCAPLASPTFTGTVTMPLSTAGLVTTTSGGVLGSEANATVAQGGTGATTAAGALVNLFPAASEVGDLVYCSAYSSGCTTWSILSGNTSGTKVLQETSAGVPSWTAAGTGTVTSFSSGNLSPLFTTSVATATTTPALSFSLSNAAAFSVLGNTLSSSGAPAYTSNPSVSSVVLNGSTSGSTTLSASATGGTLNLGSTNATVTSAGALTVASCSGCGGSPGGSNTDVQYNSSSSFAGNSGLTYDGSKTLTIGTVGSTSGILALSGSASGTATFTAPATAGTSTNPVVSSNALSLPVGSKTAPTLVFNSEGAGWFNRFGSIWTYTNGINDVVDIQASQNIGVQIGENECYGLSSGSLDQTASDTFLCRGGTSILDVTTSNASPSGNATINAGSYEAGGTAGVSAGSYSSITAITSTDGIVTQLTGTSDLRLKTGVEPYTRGLGSILALHPALYRWNEKGQKITGFPADLKQAGFIAQDVEKAIPEAVGTENHDGVDYLTLNERPILAAMVNAIKEQQAQIEELKKQIESLKSQLGLN